MASHNMLTKVYFQVWKTKQFTDSVLFILFIEKLSVNELNASMAKVQVVSVIILLGNMMERIESNNR